MACANEAEKYDVMPLDSELTQHVDGKLLLLQADRQLHDWPGTFMLDIADFIRCSGIHPGAQVKQPMLCEMSGIAMHCVFVCPYLKNPRSKYKRLSQAARAASHVAQAP